MEATSMDDRKRYNGMEKYLQRVSGTYVSVPKHVNTKNNRILKKVLEILIQKMKNTDTRFNQLYQKLFFGGSYYDGLKVGTPDEYDIDLLLQFPSTHGIEIRTGKVPGYVNLYLKNIT
uniref:Mab-21-like nucleotidyltransferase domain-containing protein n=1 Tax=Anoplophora glabripennis TaxID=217634 RepID=V5I708_ANOGL